MYDKTEISESNDGFDYLNYIDFLIVGRWVYGLRSISCFVLTGGIVQTYLTSKLKYIYILLSLLLISSISEIMYTFYNNWFFFSAFTKRSGEHELLHDKEFTCKMSFICYTIGDFCYYTAQWVFVSRYVDIALMCLKPRTIETHDIATKYNKNGFFIGAMIIFWANSIVIFE